MSIKRICALCGLACVVAAGCAKQEPSPFARPQKDSRIEVRPEAVAASRDAPEPDIEWSTFYRAARYHESTGNYREAIAQYNNALGTSANNAVVYGRLGTLYGFLGKHVEAEESFRRALAIKPEDHVTRNNLGFEYIVQERWSDAEHELRRAILMQPEFDRARINLGVALAAQEKFDEALEQFRSVLPAADALYNLGLAYRTQKRYDDAEKTFNRVLRINPKFGAARKQLDFLSRRHADPEASAAVSVIPDPVQPSTHGATVVVGGAVAGDFDADGDVDLGDFAKFQACLSQRAGTLTAECAAGDFDGDGKIDLVDYKRFQAALANP